MNTNTKKHERAIKSLAAHCWDKSNKTTYTMQHIKAVDKECQCFVRSNGYYAACLYEKHEYDLPYSTEVNKPPLNVIIPERLMSMEANTPTFFLKVKGVETVHKAAKLIANDKKCAPLCKIGEAYFNTYLLRQVMSVLGDSKIIVPGQVKVAYLISELGVGVLCPIRVQEQWKNRAVEMA